MSSKAKLVGSGVLVVSAVCVAWFIHEVNAVPTSETMRVRRLVESHKFQERFGVTPFSAPELGDTVALRVVPQGCVSRDDLPEEALLEMTEYLRIHAKLDSLQVPRLEPFFQTTNTLEDGTRIVSVNATSLYRVYPVRATDHKALRSERPETATKLENMAKVARAIGLVEEADSLERRAAEIRAVR